MQFKIENKGQIANSGIGAYLKGLDYSEQAYSVKIEPWSEKRRAKQNALSWIWYNEKADYSGNAVNYEHNLCKLEYGCPIYAKENEEFADTYENTILMLPFEIRMELIDLIPITSLLSVKGFAKYLKDMEIDCELNGCILSRPDDSYWESMGVKR